MWQKQIMCWTFRITWMCLQISTKNITQLLRQVSYARGTLIMCDILWLQSWKKRTWATISTPEIIKYWAELVTSLLVIMRSRNGSTVFSKAFSGIDSKSFLLNKNVMSHNYIKSSGEVDENETRLGVARIITVSSCADLQPSYWEQSATILLLN